MRHDAATKAPLYKRLYIKIIVDPKVGNLFPNLLKLSRDSYLRAPAGKFYTPSDIEEALEKIIEYIDAKFPRVEFRMVELAPNRFNFIACGERPPAPWNPEAESFDEALKRQRDYTERKERVVDSPRIEGNGTEAASTRDQVASK